MKHTKRILTLLLFLLFLGTPSLHAAAADAVTAEASASVLTVGEALTVTVSLDGLTASSLGVAVACDPSLTIVEGNWLKNGLIASYDMTKHKGVYTAGGPAPVAGEIFALTLYADRATSEEVSVSVTVIAKNGATTVLEETVTSTLRITCRTHTYTPWQNDGDCHSRTCSTCGETESGEHSFDRGTVTASPTCEKTGEKRFVCSICQGKKTETLPKTAHSPSLVGERAPTCQELGYSGDTICSACQASLATGSSLDKTPHHYENGVCLSCGEEDPSTPPPVSSEEEPVPPVSSERNEPTPPVSSEEEVPEESTSDLPMTSEPASTAPAETNPPVSEPTESIPTATEAPNESVTEPATSTLAPDTQDLAASHLSLLLLLPIALAVVLLTVKKRHRPSAKA